MYKISRVSVYFFLLLALILQLTVLNHLKILGAKPDIIIICVIFFGLFLGIRMGFESGLVIGFLEDIFTFDIFLINAFILGMTGLLAGILNTKFFKESKITQVCLVFLLTAFSMAIHFLCVFLFTRSTKMDFMDFLAGSILPASIYTAMVSMPIFSKFINLYESKKEDEDLL